MATRTMKSNYLTILCSLVSLFASAQSVTVRGKTSLQPIENVEIRSVSAVLVQELFTNRSGAAYLKPLADTDRLTFRQLGYQPADYTLAQVKAMNFTVFLTEKLLELNGVVISANRTAEPLSRVAQPIRVLTRSELRFLNQPTMADVLQ